MNKIIFLIVCSLFVNLSFAQVGIGTTNPDGSAKLDVTATDKGVLIPRVSLTDVTNVTTPVNSPAEGLMVYNTNTSVTGGNGAGFYFFNGTSWKKITSTDDTSSTNLKDIGVISAFPGATYPNDMYLPISGGTFNDVDYPEFANFISNLDSDVVTNNGNGTFTLANWNNNGIFLRSQGGNATALGALQNYATAIPNSGFSTIPESTTTTNNGLHNHIVKGHLSRSVQSGIGAHIKVESTYQTTVTQPNGTHNHDILIPALTIDGGDTETRPINRSIIWVIKVKPSASAISNLTINNITDIGTDDQNLTGATLTGTNLQIDIENGSSTTVDLAALQDGTGTDDQNLTGATLTGTNLQIDIENGSSTTVDLVALKNTLDQAYDQGGSGAGRTITADNGAVEITKSDDNSGAALKASATSTLNYGVRAAIEATNRNGINTQLAVFDNALTAFYGLKFYTNQNVSNIHGAFYDIDVGVNGGSNAYGSRVKMNHNGSYAFLYGYKSEITGTGNSTKYGFYTSIPNTSNGIHYGVFSDVQNSTGYAGYFIGRISLGNNTTNRYLMPSSDGTANQVMATDGAGQVSFVNSNTVGTDDQNLTGATLTGTNLQIDIENGNSVAVDLASLQDGTGTDDQNLTGATLTGTNLQIDIENGNSVAVDLAPLQDGTGTDDQTIDTFSFNTGTKILTLEVENDGIAPQTVNLSSLQDGNTQNTLDQAYDEGGAGTGRTITADNGAVAINGTDGFQVTGAYNSGAAISLSGAGTRMFFNPKKAAFRVGTVGSGGAFDTTVWDDINIGDHSFATGVGTKASGGSSFASGLQSYATGGYSTAMGYATRATLNYELAVGSFNKVVTAGRLFVIGNGIQESNRSNAFEVFNNGKVTINEEYSLPLTDGSANQVMATNGAGQVSFVDTSTVFTDTQNTLDQAYDEGGAGAGRTITADNGAVAINGTDGFQVTGTHNSGTAISLSGAGTRMFFNPKKAAFRVGIVGSGGAFDTTVWDDVNIGDNSFATGAGTKASGGFSFASGLQSYATGGYSTAMGYATRATLNFELAVGSFNKVGTTGRLFVIGNGIQESNRSNAFEVFNNGKVTINEEYSLPLTDGSTNQVMATDGAGQVSFVNSNTVGTDDQNLTGATLTGTNLQIDIENGSSTTVDLAGLQDGTGTDDQNLTGATLTGTNLQIDIENGSSTTVDLVALKNTLDQAYDQGGAGAGRIINTTDGAVLLNGTDGLKIQGAQAGIEIANTTENESGIHFRDAGNTTQYADINYDNGTNNLLNFYVNSATASMTLDDNQRVGIGTTTPSEKLSVAGTANLNEGLNGVALRVNGTEALWYNGTQFSWGFGGTENYFADKVGIGTNSPAYKLDVADTQSGNYVAQVYNKSTNINADGLRIRLKAASPGALNHFIGFYDGSDTQRGKIAGNGTGGGVTYYTTSDRRLKTHIVNIDHALEILNKMQPRKYEYKTKLGVEEYGFIAQELQPVYPQAVSGDPNGDVKTDPMMVDYSRLTPILTAGVKELKKEIETLQSTNKQLKKEVKELKEVLAKYKNLEKRLQALETKNK